MSKHDHALIYIDQFGLRAVMDKHGGQGAPMDIDAMDFKNHGLSTGHLYEAYLRRVSPRLPVFGAIDRIEPYPYGAPLHFHIDGVAIQNPQDLCVCLSADCGRGV